MQDRYNLVNREDGAGDDPLCFDQGVRLIRYSPLHAAYSPELGSGVVSGRL